MKKNKEEIISIVNNEFKSSIEDDWNGQFINLNEYWVNELKHTDQVDIKNIKDYKLFDYINKGFDLMDYYEFEDSAYINDLVPSMIYRYNPLNEDEWIWVEFKNVRGKDGWLYGLADFIAFETEESFILSFRKELVDWCESKIDLKDKVYSAEEAEYMPYTRKGKQDLISMIQLRDIENLPNTAIWKK